MRLFAWALSSQLLAATACISPAAPVPVATPASAGVGSTDVAIPVPTIDPASCIDPPWPAVEAASSAAADADAGAAHEAGRLPAELIRDIVRKKYDDFRTCYEVALGRNPALVGIVSVHFVIRRDGKVEGARVFRNELADCQLTACIRDGFTQIEFPPPDGGIVTVSYPVSLQPG